jgi:hypothetical protein
MIPTEISLQGNEKYFFTLVQKLKILAELHTCGAEVVTVWLTAVVLTRGDLLIIMLLAMVEVTELLMPGLFCPTDMEEVTTVLLVSRVCGLLEKYKKMCYETYLARNRVRIPDRDRWLFDSSFG